MLFVGFYSGYGETSADDSEGEKVVVVKYGTATAIGRCL